MSDSDPIPVVVLAAGEGKRLEGPAKPLAEVGGRAMLFRVVDAVRDGGGEPLVVLGDESGRIHAAMAEEYGDDTPEVVVNDDWKHGMSGSVRCGVRQVPTDAIGFALLPGDLPLLTGDEVRAVLDALRAADDERAIILPVQPDDHSERGHPAGFGRHWRAAFLSLPPGRPAHGIVRSNADRVTEVEINTPGPYLDVDDEDDLQEAEGRLSG